MDFRINFSNKAHNFSEEEINVVIEAMQCADPLTQGKYRDSFEKKLAKYLRVDHGKVFALSTATSALELSAQLCQFEPGDEVVIPVHTFTSSAYPFVKNRAKVVWADIDLKTRVVTAETIERCITTRTKAVVVVHLYGFLAEMEPIVKLCKSRGLLLIEDAAQALGTHVNGTMAGTFGDFGVFSFHSHKNITTLGEGGALYLKDQKMTQILPMLRHNGHCKFSFEQKEYWLPAMGNVDLPELNGQPIFPSNYCLGEIECALGAKLLDRLDKINGEKRNRAIKFIDELKDFPQLEFHRVDSERHNYHLLVARELTGKRDQVMKKLSSEKGIKVVVQYYPLNRYDFYRKLGLEKADCPNADTFFDNMISFPFHHWLCEDDFEFMLTSVKEVLGR